MTYLPEAQLPRSITRHRSLQKGASGSVNWTGLWQIGHFIRQIPSDDLDELRRRGIRQ